MNIHRIYYPVLTLGPGRRIGIWTRGCTKHCPGCMSPELAIMEPRYEIPAAVLERTLTEIFRMQNVDGVTVSGGEPLDQYEDLLRLLGHLAQYTEDILVYSGYTKKELGKERFSALHEYASLILGPYRQAENDGRALRGSANQEIIYKDEKQKERYQKTVEGPRSLQPVAGRSELFLIGIMDA